MGSLLVIFFWNQGAGTTDQTFQAAWALGSNVMIKDGAEVE